MLRPLCSLGLAEVFFERLKDLRDTSKSLNISKKCWGKNGEILKCDLVLFCTVVYVVTAVHAFLSILLALKFNNIYGISGLLYVNEEDKTPFQVKYAYFSYIFLIFFPAISFIINTKTIYSP